MADLQQFANNASSILAGSSVGNTEYAITAAQGAPFDIYVQTGHGTLFPAQSLLGEGNYFVVTIEDIATRNFEIFRVSARNADIFTISARADEGTARRNFPAGSKVELRWTRDSIERLRTYARSQAAGYTHTQTSASNSWIIQHNLNKLVEIEIWVDNGIGGYFRAEAGVNYIDANNLVIDFSEPVSGKAIIR